MPYAAAYIASLVAFVAMDFGWLSFASGRLYRPILGDLLAPKVGIAPGIAFYLIYMLGILVLAVAPALRSGQASRAALSGAVLGLAAYATYDLTNQATLRTWSIKLTLLDMGWGVFATTVAAVVGLGAGRLAMRYVG
jgi:uncharacterized membrane protein